MKGAACCLVVLVVICWAGPASAVDATCDFIAPQNDCLLPDGSSKTLEGFADGVYVAIPSGVFTLECTLTPTVPEGKEAHFLFGTIALKPHDTYESSPKVNLANDLNTLTKATTYRISADSYADGPNADYRSFWFQNSGYEETPTEAFPIALSCTMK